MFRAVAVVASLVVIAVCGEPDKSKVVLPDIEGRQLQNVNIDDCLDKSIYGEEELKNINDDNGYLCAFIAFQANKEGRNVYANRKESTKRYAIFKKCVDGINEVNTDETSTWKAGVNFFCDMTEEEKYPYSHGLKRPQKNKDQPDEEPMLGRGFSLG